MTRSLSLMVALVCAVLPAGAGTKLLRFPDIHGDRVVFCYGGDLWTADAAGGTATRLTAHPGLELFPKFSPDGRHIAFTGQYDGDEQVYVIPATGGVPEQLTFYPALGPLPPRWGYDNHVYDWSADGRSILFRSSRYSYDLGDQKLFLVSVDGGLPEALPMPETGAGDLSPDGKQVVYSPLFRDFRTWKRYEGGWAQELYVFDIASHETRRITDHPRADRDPMWVGDSIYFTSDRDGVSNLYRHRLAGGQVDKLTEHRTWDVRWPSDDGSSRIVYESDGELRVYDLGRGRDTAISIDVPDDGLATRPVRVSAAGSVENFNLSPRGKRAVFAARGDIFTVPAEKGPTRNLTHTPGTHERSPAWSPDGKWIAYLSDRSGEEEIWRIAQDGSGDPERLTRDGQVRRHGLLWSPDGSHIAFGDKDGQVLVLDVEKRKTRVVADEARGSVSDYTWSPHGGHLAFSLSDDSGFNSIYVWSAGDGKTRRVTGPLWHEFEPVWQPEGNYLFFMSDRMFQPQIGSFEWNYVVDRETGIYALALRKDVEHLLPPESDEVETEEDGEKKDDDKKKGEDKGKDEDDDKKKEKKKDPIVIDFDGLADRVVRLPVEPDNLYGLTAIEGHLVFVRGTPFYYGRSSGRENVIRIFSFEKREEKDLFEAGSYALSEDGKKLLVRAGGGYKILDAKPGGKESAKAVDTGGLQLDRVPAEEWPQIFDEVWRRFRDYFYVANMHGYDWEALRDRYRPLLADVAHRSDLNYVIGEMIAELNVSHAYISGGDYEIPDRPAVALPGARFGKDRGANRYVLEEILRGHNEEGRYRAPLTEVGVDARQGDYLIAIDGQDVTLADNPYRLLRHKADRPVELTLNDRPSDKDARKVVYDPITSERSLRYLRMVTTNREKVEALTDGRVGYLHIPDMGSNGIREFIKYFYGQIRKEGLVVDVRGNGGGNVSQMIIERLKRELLGTRFARRNDTPGTYPAVVFHGHMACLLDEDSASDGDIFPHRFREAGLGPLIGKRSWGGVVGITNHGPLIDGGSVNVPEFGTNGVDGSWVIEGRGVDPDIEVTNDPKSLLAGRDPQLERAVEEILAAMKREPRKLPARPADPVKTP